MTEGQAVTVNFVFDKTTPGTVRYQEVDDAGNRLTAKTGATIGNLYVRKEKLNGQTPQKLKVIITAG